MSRMRLVMLFYSSLYLCRSNLTDSHLGAFESSGRRRSSRLSFDRGSVGNATLTETSSGDVDKPESLILGSVGKGKCVCVCG